MNSISRRYVLRDLEELSQQKTEELSTLTGQDLQLEWPPSKGREWKFRDWELDLLVRGYREYSLFELKATQGKPRAPRWPGGCPHVDFDGPLMPLKSDGKPYVHEFLEVVCGRPVARLYSHEYLTQFSSAAELAGVYGQPRERLLAEAPLPSGGYAIDLAVFDGPRPPEGSGKPVIGGEIKLTLKGHQHFINALMKCRALSGDHPDHRKCEWIQQNPSVQYLWVRSQDQADLLKVQRAANKGFDLELVPTSKIDVVLSRRNW